jgi:hypothetical protein
MPSNNVTVPLASTLLVVVSWWQPTWQQSAKFPDLYGLCLQLTTMKHFCRVPTSLTHCYHAQQQRHCPLGFYITCGGLMVAAYISAECGIFPDLYGLCLQGTTMNQFSRVPTGLTHCYQPSNNVTAPLASTLLVAAEFPDLYGLCLQRTTMKHFCRVPTGLTHCYHAQQQLHCPLGFYITCGGLMVAAYMAAECGISRRVRLVPPANHHESL